MSSVAKVGGRGHGISCILKMSAFMIQKKLYNYEKFFHFCFAIFLGRSFWCRPSQCFIHFGHSVFSGEKNGKMCDVDTKQNF